MPRGVGRARWMAHPQALAGQLAEQGGVGGRAPAGVCDPGSKSGERKAPPAPVTLVSSAKADSSVALAASTHGGLAVWTSGA